MQYKKNVFGILIFGLVVIVMDMYFLPLSENSALNQSPQNTDKSVPNDIPIDYNNVSEESRPLHLRGKLNNAVQIYAASEAHSQCDVENVATWERLEVLKNAIMTELRGINESRLIRDAVFLLQGEGYFKTYEALFTLQQLQLENEAKYFQIAPLRPTQEDLEEFRRAAHFLGEVQEAATRQDIELTIQTTINFRRNNIKRGFVFRRGRNNLFWTPDVIIGHNLATAQMDFVDDIAARYPVNHTLFTQAVRSEASVETLEKLLSSFDFSNTPIYTKHNKLQTALQSAIEIKSLDAMRLILSQPDINHTDFFHNPLNTIIFDTLRTGNSEFTDTQKEMMALLVEHGFSVDIVTGPIDKSLMLAGYTAMLEQPILDQLKALSIPPRRIAKFRILPDSALPLDLQDQLKRDVFQSQVLINELNEKAEICRELKLALRSLVTPLIRIDDIFSFVSTDNSFAENIELLKQQSLTLVDAYYSRMARESEDTQRVDLIVASTHSLQDIPLTVREQIDALTPFERHHLNEVYCEKFGKRSMEDIFAIVQYMNPSLLSFESCLVGSRDYYTETKLAFYLHENTYPGLIYRKLASYSIDDALDALTNPAFQRPKDLDGHPHGRDALMLALDLKLATNSFNKNDYKALISALISKTQLKGEHFKRLHRLKVEHFLFFEELASFHPQFRQATDYPLAIYRTPN